MNRLKEIIKRLSGIQFLAFSFITLPTCPILIAGTNTTPILITAAEINAGGFTISNSGDYLLSENAAYNPTQGGTAAITITASNATIDLNGKTLSLTETTSPTDGILVASSMSKKIEGVTITNGAITGFTGNGITIQPGAEVVLSSINCMNNVAPKGNGVHATKATILELGNCNFTGNYGSGIMLINCYNVIFEHCDCSSNAVCKTVQSGGQTNSAFDIAFLTEG